MSILSAFANAAFTAASTVIGTVTFTIAGGSSVAAVRNEARHKMDFEDGGFAPDAALELVTNTTTFRAAYTSAANAYIGKLAVVGNVTYRVGMIGAGGSTTLIGLSHTEDT